MSEPAYELRIYTLASAEALDDYATKYYPKHEESLRELFGVTVHGYWRATGTDAFQLYVLMSYPPDADPEVVRQEFRNHPSTAANMPGFDPSFILEVSVAMLVPAPGSPLR